MNNMEKSVKNLLVEKLDNYKGSCIYGCDLAFTLLESENCDGSIDCSSYKAMQWIKENFSELGDVIEDIELNFGEKSIPNVFLEPEKFQVVCYLEIASKLISKCEFVNNNWNVDIMLDEENINIIKNQLNQL